MHPTLLHHHRPPQLMQHLGAVMAALQGLKVASALQLQATVMEDLADHLDLWARERRLAARLRRRSP